jgi:hypothetical protein
MIGGGTLMFYHTSAKFGRWEKHRIAGQPFLFDRPIAVGSSTQDTLWTARAKAVQQRDAHVIIRAIRVFWTLTHIELVDSPR